jgi:uncharacterized protein YbjQ (UPF0145 family)
MNLFGSGKPVDPEKLARDEASQRSIAAGGLPQNAIDRLTEQEKRAREGKPFFTSDLSPNELLLTHQCGFEPLGQVMGSCVYQVGWQNVPTAMWVYSSGEMQVLSNSQIEARGRAFSRLKQEAQLLGADGVVGVRFTREESNFGSSTIEFMAVGTAVRRIDAPPLGRGQEPFVSNLSGQDHWALRQHGYAPLGFVFGTCAWYQYPDWRSSSAMMSWSNAELTSLSQGLYTAREIAMSRLEFETRSLRASGVVGVTFESHIEVMEQNNQSSPGGFIMHCTAWGTAIGVDVSITPPRTSVTPIVFLNAPPTQS